MSIDTNKRQDAIIRIAQREHFGIGKIGLIKALRLMEGISLVKAKVEIERLFDFSDDYRPIKKEL